MPLTSSSPLLSIVMPSYNHGKYLQKRLDSLLQEMGEEDELIIVDDASTDNSREITLLYAQKDPRIQVILQDKNQGYCKAVQVGLTQAHGTYLFLPAVDDVCFAGALKKTLAALQKHPQAVLCCSDFCSSLERESKPPVLGSQPLLKQVCNTLYLSPQQVSEAIRKQDFLIPGHTSVIKRETFIKYGGLNELFGPHMDWFTMHEIALNEGVLYLPEPLFLMRFHGKNYSSTGDINQYQRAIFKFLQQPIAKKTKKLFLQSKLMRIYTENQFLWVCLRPIHWCFLFNGFSYILFKFFQKVFRSLPLKWRKIIKSLLGMHYVPPEINFTIDQL